MFIVTCHIRRRIVRASLCTNMYEMATDADVFLDRHRTGCRYDLLAQGEVYGYLHADQVVQHLGSIPRREGRAIDELWKEDAVGCNALPLHGPSDPRWKFKQEELTRMYTVALPAFDERVVGPA